jgi:hypothetical protein
VILEAWIRFAMDPAGSNSSLGEEETPSIAKIFATLCLTFFGNLWYILIPNVLYHLLQGYKSLQSENDTSAPLIFMPRKWILCMLVVNYVSAIIFWLISVLDYDAVKSRDDMNTHSHRFQLATHVLLFVAALEIMIETCAIVSSRKDLPPLSRVSYSWESLVSKRNSN